MKEIIKTEDMPSLATSLQTYMEGKREELAELDSLTGDGDMGVTIALIFRAITKYCKSLDTSMSLKDFFGEVQEAVGENAPSTFGTFVATMLKAVSKEVGDINEIDGAVYANMLEWAAAGVMKRGGAKLGDKTLLDALIPAGEAAKGKASLCEACEAAAAAALEGAEKTIELKAATGRAGYMGERTIGNKDPGATAVSYMLEAIRDFVKA